MKTLELAEAEIYELDSAANAAARLLKDCPMTASSPQMRQMLRHLESAISKLQAGV